MKINELRKLDSKKFQEKELELKKELMKLLSQVASGTPPENPGMVKSIKRDLARILTIKKEVINKK